MTRNGTFTPQATKDFERAIQVYLMMARPMLRQNAVAVELDLCFERPKSVPKSRLFHTVKPDCDNAAKAVLDAANGILWVDDAQVISLRVIKAYGVKACIIMRVRDARIEDLK